MERDQKNRRLEYKKMRKARDKRRWIEEGLCTTCGRERHPEVDKEYKSCLSCRLHLHPLSIKEDHGYINLEDSARL